MVGSRERGARAAGEPISSPALPARAPAAAAGSTRCPDTDTDPDPDPDLDPDPDPDLDLDPTPPVDPYPRDARYRLPVPFPCRARIFSISSMMAFISAIAASNGFEVVMSTPASRSRSTGYLDPPARSIAR
jgi:hypothetical protein